MIVNGGYAKVAKQLYAFEIRNSIGSYCEFAYAASRKEACAMAVSDAPSHVRIKQVWDESNMPADLLEQAKDWLYGRQPETMRSNVPMFGSYPDRD